MTDDAHPVAVTPDGEPVLKIPYSSHEEYGVYLAAYNRGRAAACADRPRVDGETGKRLGLVDRLMPGWKAYANGR